MHKSINDAVDKIQVELKKIKEKSSRTDDKKLRKIKEEGL